MSEGLTLNTLMQFYNSGGSDEDLGNHFDMANLSRSEALDDELLKIVLARSLLDSGEIPHTTIVEHQLRLNDRLIECGLEYKTKVARINSTSLSFFSLCLGVCFYFCSRWELSLRGNS